MSIFEEKSRAVAGMVEGEANAVAIDPFVITIIATILVEVIKLYRECRESAPEITTSFHRPGLIERWRLRRIVRKHLDDEDVHGVLARPLHGAILRMASTLTEEEVRQMWIEA